MTVKINIKGIDKLVKAIRQAGDRGESEIGAGIFQEGEQIMTESKGIVPVLTAALKDSGIVEKPVRQGNTITVTLGYGGPAAQYAIFVHEDLTAKHTSGQSAKFLSIPFKKRSKTFGNRLANRIRAALQ